MSTIKPITPREAASQLALPSIPNYVFTAVNMLLADRVNLRVHADVNFIQLSQDAIVEAILRLAPPDVVRQDVFDRYYLDFEQFYRNAGWDVTFYKPPYYETSGSYFVFKSPDLNEIS